MGANAQTSVPTFTAGEVLTAANMNISARTGIPVFADTTARDAAFGGTGEKTLAEGQYAYIENIAGSAATQYYDGSAWQTLVVGGLTLIKTQTIGTTVSSVEVTGAFSATYDAYKIVVSGGASSATNTGLRLTLGATATGYAMQLIYGAYSGTPLAAGATNQSSWLYAGGSVGTTTLNFSVDLYNPFLSEFTLVSSLTSSTVDAGFAIGYLNDTTSYSAFTITAASGTLTGGTIRVYGYATS